MNKAVVLGGTTPHVELINILKRKGYYVILIDYLEKSPGAVVADRHIMESTLDKEKVLEIAKAENADLVISTCIDQANSVCCYVAEELGLPKPYSYETSLNVTDKGRMKEIFIRNGIPTSAFQVASNYAQINRDYISFPSVVKPVDCNSSKGVRKVENFEEVEKYLSDALNFSRSKKAIIEGYVKGVEIQVDCFAKENGAEVILTRQKKHIQADETDELNSEGSIIPAPICKNRENDLKKIACNIARAFNLHNTPFFFQAIVDEYGEIYVLEFAPRIGGGLSYYILKEIAGFNAIHAAINSYLGIYEDPVFYSPDGFYSTNLLYMNEGVFDHIVGFEDAKERGIIFESFVTKEKGTHIGNKLRSGNRVGAFIVKADSLEGIKEKERLAYELIDILSADGASQIRKWRD